MTGIATRRISEPLTHQFPSRSIHCRIHPRMTAEYALRVNQYRAVHFFHGFLPHMISYAEFILIVVGGDCRSVRYFCTIISWMISLPHLDIYRNAIKYLNVWFIHGGSKEKEKQL